MNKRKLSEVPQAWAKKYLSSEILWEKKTKLPDTFCCRTTKTWIQLCNQQKIWFRSIKHRCTFANLAYKSVSAKNKPFSESDNIFVQENSWRHSLWFVRCPQGKLLLLRHFVASSQTISSQMSGPTTAEVNPCKTFVKDLQSSNPNKTTQ